MRNILTIIAVGVCCNSGLVSAVGPFEPGKEREWEFLDQAKFRGTLVGMDEGKGDVFTKLRFIVQVEDRDHLERLMRRLRHVHGVTKLARE